MTTKTTLAKKLLLKEKMIPSNLGFIRHRYLQQAEFEGSGKHCLWIILLHKHAQHLGTDAIACGATGLGYISNREAKKAMDSELE